MQEPQTEPARIWEATLTRWQTAETERAQLDYEWGARLRFRAADTMTEEEARSCFDELAEYLSLAARIRCHVIVDSLPVQVIPEILPQLQDIAEYEVRMWQVRREVEGPDIHDRWVSLPVTR
jgi:hypothetical protein